MRLGVRWLEGRRFREARADGENLEDVSLWLVGADRLAKSRRMERALSVVREAGGEIAS